MDLLLESVLLFFFNPSAFSISICFGWKTLFSWKTSNSFDTCTCVASIPWNTSWIFNLKKKEFTTSLKCLCHRNERVSLEWSLLEYYKSKTLVSKLYLTIRSPDDIITMVTTSIRNPTYYLVHGLSRRKDLVCEPNQPRVDKLWQVLKATMGMINIYIYI